MIVDDEGMVLLGPEECQALLRQATIGRVAVSIGAVPAVFPVNFVVVDDGIAFLTGKGTKLDAAVRNAVIAFEVDDFDAVYHTGWSVLVVGTAQELVDPIAKERVVMAGATAWAPGQRDHVILLRPEFMSGRRIDVHDESPATQILG